MAATGLVASAVVHDRAAADGLAYASLGRTGYSEAHGAWARPNRHSWRAAGSSQYALSSVHTLEDELPT